MVKGILLPDVSKVEFKKMVFTLPSSIINEASVPDGSPPSTRAVLPMDLPTISEDYVSDD